MFEPVVFRKQIYCIEESTCDIVGTFGRPCSPSVPPAEIRLPCSDSPSGELCPLAPPVTPLLASRSFRSVTPNVRNFVGVSLHKEYKRLL